jgi:hypothetical protein
MEDILGIITNSKDAHIKWVVAHLRIKSVKMGNYLPICALLHNNNLSECIMNYAAIIVRRYLFN